MLSYIGVIMFKNPNLKKISCELEKELFQNVIEKTPDYIKELNLIDLDNKNEFVFTLKKEHLYPYDKDKNPHGLGLWAWFDNYEKEAKVSTAGIRGPQNILYPQDTRFPINLIGITLATLAKALVITQNGYKDPTKLVGREVRYNSDLYLEAIARIQAAKGIKTLVPEGKQTIPIWLASFLVFKLGLVGGEYITSSHGISVKNATKDLNSQGGQYLPEESMEFVLKIRGIFEQTEKDGSYKITFAKADDPMIDENTMKLLNDGVDMYVDYLRTGVAKDLNLELIRNLKKKIVIENIGGSAYRTLSRVLKKLNIEDKYDWLNIAEDPFFHSIGKYNKDSEGNSCFYDYSVDATVTVTDEICGKYYPVIISMHYESKLADYPVNTVVLITDPDHDRLTVTQIEDAKNIPFLDEIGVDYVNLSRGRILTVFTANQAFLMMMNWRLEKLKTLGLVKRHPLFIIKTTASTVAWDEWAHHNGIKIINVPVGFKEIAGMMKKIETQMQNNPEAEVIVTDIFGQQINLGVNPRLLFAGEESGGMIMGPSKLICSDLDCKALAMREKSATEAIIVSSAMASKQEARGKTLSQFFVEVLKENKIKGKFDTRVDIAYYNESESDINKLNQAKKAGEEMRTKNDLFYLALAMANNYEILTLEQIKQILNDTFKELDFSGLKDIKFVGDGTYLRFDDKFIEIRPSGTDAKTKAYAAGKDKNEIEKYTKIMGYYSGELTDLYKELVSTNFYYNAKDNAMSAYLKFLNSDAQ